MTFFEEKLNLCILRVGRIGKVKRVTKETNVSVEINLDGVGITDSSTSVPFLDHMLDVSNFTRSLCHVFFLSGLVPNVSDIGFVYVAISFTWSV